MLNKLQIEILNGWVILLNSFLTKVSQNSLLNPSQSKQWQDIEQYFSTNIMNLSCDDLSYSQVNLWQSWQTETHRLIRLLKTDLLFLLSAKQDLTKKERLTLIEAKLHNAIQLTENLQRSLN
jgi:hypothetical protein